MNLVKPRNFSLKSWAPPPSGRPLAARDTNTETAQNKATKHTQEGRWGRKRRPSGAPHGSQRCSQARAAGWHCQQEAQLGFLWVPLPGGWFSPAVWPRKTQSAPPGPGSWSHRYPEAASRTPLASSGTWAATPGTSHIPEATFGCCNILERSKKGYFRRDGSTSPGDTQEPWLLFRSLPAPARASASTGQIQMHTHLPYRAPTLSSYKATWFPPFDVRQKGFQESAEGCLEVQGQEECPEYAKQAPVPPSYGRVK